MTPEEIIDLVHEIDELEDQKRGIDEQIAAKKRRLASASSGTSGNGVSRFFAKGKKRRKPSPQQDKAVAFLSKSPDANYKTLSDELYGEHTPAKINAARSLISNMRESN